MTRNFLITASVLLTGLLVFSAVQTFSGNFASAATGQAVFCPNRYLPPPNGPDTYNELSLSSDTCYYIVCMLAARTNWGCYWEEDTSEEEYFSILSTLATWYYPQIVFSKGHNTPWDYEQLGLLDHDGNHVKDSEIFDYTEDGSFVFTFLWHCATTYYYPPHTGPQTHGHPYCWTHDANMEKNQYDDSEPCFIGWRWTSPQFEAYCPDGLYNAQYAHFVYVFWESMTDGSTVQEALSDARIVLSLKKQVSFRPLLYLLFRVLF